MSNNYSYIFNAHPSYIEEMYKKYQDTPETIEDGWRAFFEGFEFNAKYLSNLVKHTTVRPEVINMLTKLKAHFKMSIITNGLKEVQRPRLDKCLMTHLFDSIIVSDEIGAAKPDLAFFDVAIKSIPITIKKDKILVIGDSLKSDIAGGINYGLKTCLIGPYDSFLLVNADIVVQDVLALEQLLLDVYQPIDCGFYDYLEIYCMRKTSVKIDCLYPLSIVLRRTGLILKMISISRCIAKATDREKAEILSFNDMHSH